jgi:hypothetical protein
MHAAAERIDELRQRVHVRRLQLRKLAVLEDLGHDLVLVAQRLESVRVRRVAGLGSLAHRQPQVLEQDLRQLLRRVEVELLPGQLFDARLDRRELPAELVLHLLEVRHIDGDALGLHVGEDARERQLDLVKEVIDAEVAHLGFEAWTQVEDRLRAARRKLGGFALRDRRRLARRAPRPQQLLAAHELHAEELARQVLEAWVA